MLSLKIRTKFVFAELPARIRKTAAVSCLVFLAGSYCGCARIPREAIQVNSVLQTNISDARKKHEALVHALFDTRRAAMDDWFLKDYEPAFLRNFKSVWDRQRPTDPFDISKPAHRREFVQNLIAEHQELEAQVSSTENEFRDALERGYGSMLEQNQALGKLIQSAYALTEAEKNLWNSTAGELIPGLSTAAIDNKLKNVRDKMMLKKAGNQ